jgi:hypothetical protein
MASKTLSAKDKVAKAYHKFELKGLTSYGKYLEKELKKAEGKNFKKSYHAYLSKEIIKNELKISKVISKLK